MKSKFRENYIKWVKKDYPHGSDIKLRIIADSYLEYFEFLSYIKDPELLKTQIEIAKQEINWHFTTKEEILLDIMISGENGSINKSYRYVDKSLIFLNAFLLNKNSLGFKTFIFEEKLESKGLLPYNRKIENYLYKLNEINLIDLKFKSTPKAKIAEKGIKLLQQKDITFFIKKGIYKEVIIPQNEFDEFYNKSLLDKELLLAKYLL